jgi:hypothetical protein
MTTIKDGAFVAGEPASGAESDLGGERSDQDVDRPVDEEADGGEFRHGAAVDDLTGVVDGVAGHAARVQCT